MTVREKLRVAVNIAIAALVPAAWTLMAFRNGGLLSAGGIYSLKYFTVLSNFMAGAAALAWLIDRAGGGLHKDAIERFKYISAAAVFLTFVVIMGFLGPLYGYIAMLSGANFWFHLVIPVISVLEIPFLSDSDYTVKDNNLTVIAPLVYGTGYIINILINGIGTYPDTNDWYLFLMWGWPAGILIFAGICAVIWLLAFLMRKVQRSVRKKRTAQTDR